jgi:hypothetical protein
MTKNSIYVTFRADRLVTITCNEPAIPDSSGQVKSTLDAIITTAFGGTHNVLHSESRAATLIPIT